MTFFTWVIVAGAIVSVSSWLGCWKERRALDRSIDGLNKVLEKQTASMREHSIRADERTAIIEHLAAQTTGRMQVVFSRDVAPTE